MRRRSSRLARCARRSSGPPRRQALGVEIDEEIEYEAMSIDPSAPVVQAAMAAVRSAGIVPVAKPVTGGTDALILSNRGLEAVVLGLGGEKAHTTEEFIPVAALEKGAEILRNLLESLA